MAQGEGLHPVVAGVADREPHARFQGKPQRRFELPGAPSRAPELPEELPAAVKDLNARIPGIQHIDLVVRRNNDVLGAVELTVQRAFFAGFPQKRAVAVVFSEPVVAAVDDIDIARTVDGQVNGFAELAALRAALAERAEEHPFGAEDLDPFVAGVGHTEVALGAERNARGLVELALAGAGLADHVQQRSFAAVFLDAVVVRIGDPDVPGIVHGHAARAFEHAGLRPPGPETGCAGVPHNTEGIFGDAPEPLVDGQA